MGAIYTIDLWGQRDWGDCCLCEDEKRLTNAIGYYCGPTHDEIGTESTEYPGAGNIVGGMRVCQPCHDAFYGISAPDRRGEPWVMADQPKDGGQAFPTHPILCSSAMLAAREGQQ